MSTRRCVAVLRNSARCSPTPGPARGRRPASAARIHRSYRAVRARVPQPLRDDRGAERDVADVTAGRAGVPCRATTRMGAAAAPAAASRRRPRPRGTAGASGLAGYGGQVRQVLSAFWCPPFRWESPARVRALTRRLHPGRGLTGSQVTPGRRPRSGSMASSASWRSWYSQSKCSEHVRGSRPRRRASSSCAASRSSSTEASRSIHSRPGGLAQRRRRQRGAVVGQHRRGGRPPGGQLRAHRAPSGTMRQRATTTSSPSTAAM